MQAEGGTGGLLSGGAYDVRGLMSVPRAVNSLGLGALVVTHAMLRRLTSWRCIIIIIINVMSM